MSFPSALSLRRTLPRCGETAPSITGRRCVRWWEASTSEPSPSTELWATSPQENTGSKRPAASSSSSPSINTTKISTPLIHHNWTSLSWSITTTDLVVLYTAHAAQLPAWSLLRHKLAGQTPATSELNNGHIIAKVSSGGHVGPFKCIMYQCIPIFGGMYLFIYLIYYFYLFIYLFEGLWCYLS